MPLRIHGTILMPDTRLRLIGDVAGSTSLSEARLWLADRVVARTKTFNPNYCEDTPPSHPRKNYFFIDLANVDAQELAPAKLDVRGSGEDQTLDVRASIRDALACTSPADIEICAANVLANPRRFDRVIEHAASSRPRAIHQAVRSLDDGGILELVPREFRVKWLDLALFSLLHDGFNERVVEELDRAENMIARLAPGSYAESAAQAARQLLEGNLSASLRTYEAAPIRDSTEVSPWSSGMAGILGDATLQRFMTTGCFFHPALNMIGEPPDRKPTILVSADSTYFDKFGPIYISSALQHLTHWQVHYNVVNPTESVRQRIQDSVASLGGAVSFSASYVDLGRLDDPNRRGFYTLNRFLILGQIAKLVDAPVVVTEADAKIAQGCEAVLERMAGHDLGYIALQRYVRPWLHTTAPLLYVGNTEAARFFCDALLATLIAILVRNNSRLLWGADQAAIYCATRFVEQRRTSIKSLNVVPFVKHAITQAQEHPRGKDGFLAENAASR